MQAFLKIYFGFPFQDVTRARDIRLALLWIAHTARIFDIRNAALVFCQAVNGFCKLQDGHLVLVANVDWQMFL